jgi:hypothetical protein
VTVHTLFTRPASFDEFIAEAEMRETTKHLMRQIRHDRGRKEYARIRSMYYNLNTSAHGSFVERLEGTLNV